MARRSFVRLRCQRNPAKSEHEWYFNRMYGFFALRAKKPYKKREYTALPKAERTTYVSF